MLHFFLGFYSYNSNPFNRCVRETSPHQLSKLFIPCTTLDTSHLLISPLNLLSMNSSFISVTLDTSMKFKSQFSPSFFMAAFISFIKSFLSFAKTIFCSEDFLVAAGFLAAAGFLVTGDFGDATAFLAVVVCFCFFGHIHQSFCFEIKYTLNTTLYAQNVSKNLRFSEIPFRANKRQSFKNHTKTSITPSFIA